jgi:UDP-N-acetylglucosamine/UDP-N-acetylgalactosamine diphosphorylase
MSVDIDRLAPRLAAAGQQHLVDALEALAGSARESLARQLAAVDLALVGRHAELLRAASAGAGPRRFEPPEVFPLARTHAQRARASRATELGQEALARGAVGYLTVAGGQASRLGYEGPKGAFRIGPVSDWSLFEIHARRLRAAQLRWKQAAPWYVMTSRANEQATREFFESHAYFGLDPRTVRFFSQAMVPALDPQGRILMAGPSELFLAPNGHGGSLQAFAESGALDDARSRGIRHLSYFQVDNPLAPPADALFIGLHRLEGASMSSKVVRKRDAAEKVGVLGRVDGKLACIEYSDLPPELREARDAQGELAFGAGNIAMHVIDVEFIAELNRGGLQLPWHVAKKSMRVWEAGCMRETSGAKFETFVFDALESSPRSVTLEVERASEFSPVKNKSGEDSPDTTRADLCRMHAEWVRAAGLTLPPPDARGIHPVEVDPLFAEDRETFVARRPGAPLVTERGHLYR